MPTPTRPLRRDAEENRRRLLAAAAEMVAGSSQATTMDEVAARAGVGVGTAYRRFANKDELIAALFEQLLIDLVAIADDALEQQNPWEGVVRFFEGTLGLQASHRVLKTLILGSPDSGSYVAQVRRELRPRLETLTDRAHRAGCLRPGIEATDLVVAQLMISAVAESAGDQETWRRFLPLILDSLSADHADPLPGRAMRPKEVDAVVEARAKPASRP